MHILTLTPFYPTASDEANGCFVAEPLAAMSEPGLKLSVLSLRPWYRSSRPGAAAPVAEWVGYFAVPGGWGLSSAGAFLFASLLGRVRKLHHSDPINLIHAHAALPCGRAAALLSRELKIPFVVTVHGLDAFFTNQVRGWVGKGCERVSRHVYQTAAHVVCISEQVRARVLEECRECNTQVVYNGVDPELFAPAAENAGENLVVLSVGNLIPVKGHETLLRAIAMVQPQYPDLSWELIGDGPERHRLEGLAKELKVSNVRFLGRRSRREVADAMRRSTVFALPSRYEGLGCVYLEAMACGKPAIACREQGIEEVIQHRVNGWLVNVDSSRELAGALAILLKDLELRQQIGRSARSTVLNRFTLRHQAEQLIGVYRECMR